MIYEGPYWQLYTRKDQLLHLGYDYRNKMMENTMSARMFSTNETFTTFLTYVNDIMYSLVEAVKEIKVFANIAADKNEKRLN